MVSWATDRMDLVVAGPDKGLYHKSWTSRKGWDPEEQSFHRLGLDPCVGDPVTVTRREDSLDVFTIGTSSQLYHHVYENGKWKERECLGGASQHSAAAIALSQDRVDVFIVGLDGGLWHKWYDGQYHPSKPEFERIAGHSRDTPTVVSWGTNHMDVYWLGFDGRVYYIRWDGSAFLPGNKDYFNLGGKCQDTPAAVSWGEKRVDLVVRGVDHRFYHKYWDDGKWVPENGWTGYDGQIISRPHLVSWGRGRLDLFAIDQTRSLVHQWYMNGAWSSSGWEKVGVECWHIDQVVCRGWDRIDIFYRGVDDIQHHTWYAPWRWHPRRDRMGAVDLGRPLDATLATNVPVTGVVDTNPETAIQPRLEISDLHSRHKEQFDLFLRAFRCLQLKPETSSLSFYGIGSIHGVPYIRWPFEEKAAPDDNKSGYCCHRSVLFPVWHRLYMLLLEQAIQAEAVEIAKEFTGAFREVYANAAAKLRFPFWDWTKDNSALPRAATYQEVSVAHGGPNGVVDFKRIPNPLLKYTFRDAEMHKKHFINGRPFDQNAPEQVWSDYLQTMRCPNADGESQHDIVDTQLYKQNRNVRDMVYKLMTVNEYQPFASTGYEPGAGNINNTQSLEGIHDGIHVLVGIDPTPLDGHMGDPMYAGFDPVFFLHHCNVDRLFALWSCCHPGVTVEPQVAKETIIFYETGKVQDENTPLYPYRHTDGKYFTSKDVDDWDAPKRWGYRYPEMPEDLLQNGDAETMKKYVRKQVIKLFGPRDIRYPNVPRDAVEHANKMNALAKNAEPGTNYMEDTFQITPGQYPDFNVSSAHRREWLVNLKIENFAIDGSFNIHFFLGDFNPSPMIWTQDVNLAATHSVFSSAIGDTQCENCIKDAGNNAVVSGGISLTSKLLEKGLLDLEPDNVIPYLKENLHWHVQMANGTYVQSSEIQSLAISVSCTIIELPDNPDELPQWGVPQIFTDVTKGKAGGARQGTQI